VHTVAAGDQLELRGPVGGWFVWHPEQHEPVQLVAGGSGIVPLMAMLRARTATRSAAPFRLLYSVRSPAAMLYADELQQRARQNDGVAITFVYTRSTPLDWPASPGRIDAGIIAAEAWSPSVMPTCYVCGPTEFVEAAAGFLETAGHETSRIRTERFGPSGGTK
jgi:ferredoxin-NADP reductase